MKSLACVNFHKLCNVSVFVGSAGAVVAARLSEVHNWTVLLLEAGGDETEVSDVPALAGFLQLSDLDWKYKTKRRADRSYCGAMINDECRFFGFRNRALIN